MIKKILIGYQFPREWFLRLEDKFELIFPKDLYWDKAELTEAMRSADGMLSVFASPVDKDMLASSSIKIISNFGVGYNNIDIEAATARGIVVTNTPDPVTEPTAELAFGLMIDIARNISNCNNHIRKPGGLQWGVMQNIASGLNGKRLGIIGMGAIGQAVARRAVASQMEVVYYNRKQLPLDIELMYKAKLLPLNELVSTSDFISLHCPLTPETHHLINTNRLMSMKPTAFLINTARGSVIDEIALAAALQKNEIAGAALDVFEKEPNIEPELIKCNNAILVPHIGTATLEARINMANQVIDNLINYFENRPESLNIVNPTVVDV